MAARHGRFGQWAADAIGTASVAFEFRFFRCYRGEFPEDINDCDAYVLTGSVASAQDQDPWIKTLSALIKDASKTKPVVGICFGHQLCHQTFGGKIEVSNKGWGVGVHQYDVVDAPDWMVPQLETLRLKTSHGEQVVQAAKGTSVIATSEFCLNSVTTIGNNILTIQGHPDFTRALSRDIYEGRRASLGDSIIDEALLSLSQPVDDAAVNEWIAHFIVARI